MGLLHKDSPAKKFVKDMHDRQVTLDAFIRLFCAWTQLTPEQRQEVYDICELNHPGLYHDVFPEEDENESSRDE